jgi:mannose-1-phosphate guanylyltransferase
VRLAIVHITPVILSGGGGTRLWPMSRPECPKQFLALTSDKTMFQMTLERVSDRATYNPPVIVCGNAHRDLVERQLLEIGIIDGCIILEPSARNTAPAIALAALVQVDPKSPLLVMPSDHVITDIASFHTAIQSAKLVLDDGWMSTFGIEPSAPETGYGYIQMADTIAPNVNRVERFIEKPDHERAAEMISGGSYVWNAGIFLFRADSYLDALSLHAPDISAAVQSAMSSASLDGNLICPDAAAFAASPSDSIDYAVMEKADRVAVVPVNMGWSDVGSWDALYDLEAIALPENATEIEGSGNLIRSDGIRIHIAGVQNMIIVASGNDIMIVPRGKSQDVKKIVEALRTKIQ